ncbi:hypothetical protein SLOPH_1737 [Spraguea lophii 42_110]|uniref:Uncharacterized protein n=1 Tax=Spraguea lophii (strain 42_110) TaxID=1358809 RepID=S7W8H5_SPRLO|nr:hypothetical protein SLOPH_1737 [Spraguea lophii 42_110]
MMEIYFIFVIFTTLFSFLFARNFIRHGYYNKLLSKNNYSIFYFVGLLTLFPKINFFNLHLTRRFIETIIFRYNKSRMSIFQFLFGISYYFFLSLHLRDKNIKISFYYILLNIIQFCAHYQIFYKKNHKLRYTHYICEFLIYLHIYNMLKTNILKYNLFYLALFIFVTVYDRERMSFRNIFRKKKI